MIEHSFPQNCVKRLSSVRAFNSIGKDAPSVAEVLSYTESSGRGSAQRALPMDSGLVAEHTPCAGIPLGEARRCDERIGNLL